jgi:hypothetical protein
MWQLSNEHAGGCACGAVRFVTRGSPVRAGLCHCLTCRKAHAAAFNPFVVFTRDQVERLGEVQVWESAPGHRREFCPRCGSRLFMIEGDEVEIAMGSFDDPSLFRPEYEVWVTRRETWLPPLDVPQHHRNRADG